MHFPKDKWAMAGKEVPNQGNINNEKSNMSKYKHLFVQT